MPASFRFSLINPHDNLSAIVEMIGWLPDHLPGDRCAMTTSGRCIIVEIPDDADAIFFKMKWQNILKKTKKK
jgi:hypothetical protein